jgi:hypothetical protein
VNTLRREFEKNGAKMHFSLQAHCQKDEKWPFFGSIFAKARLGFHFLFIFISFSVSILRKMVTKWNGKWFKNEWKMNQKCQLWTTLITLSISLCHIFVTAYSPAWTLSLSPSPYLSYSHRNVPRLVTWSAFLLVPNHLSFV